MVEPLHPGELDALPVFPLPQVVFFPGTMLPLHLFEPRYRAMVEDCMERGPRAMAVALLAPGWEPHYEGRPAIHTIAGAGRIVEHHQRPDGTHDIVLAGTSRVQLSELPVEGLAYRRASATRLIDAATPAVPPADVGALWACASQVAAVVRGRHPEFSLGTSPEDPPGRMADVLANRLIADLALRQELLEMLDPGERVRRVTGAVGELLARVAPHDARPS